MSYCHIFCHFMFRILLVMQKNTFELNWVEKNLPNQWHQFRKKSMLVVQCWVSVHRRIYALCNFTMVAKRFISCQKSLRYCHKHDTLGFSRRNAIIWAWFHSLNLTQITPSVFVNLISPVTSCAGHQEEEGPQTTYPMSLICGGISRS